MARRYKKKSDTDNASVEQIQADLMRSAREDSNEDSGSNSEPQSDASDLLNAFLAEDKAGDAAGSESLLDELVGMATLQDSQAPREQHYTHGSHDSNDSQDSPDQQDMHDQHEQQGAHDPHDPHGLNNAENVTAMLEDPTTGQPAEMPDAASSLSMEGIEEGLKSIKKKRKRIWPLFIASAAIFIVLTVGFVYWGHVIEAEEGQMLSEADQDAQDTLDESIALIQNADTVIVALDKSYAVTITEDDIPKLEALIAQKDTVLETLDEAATKAEDAEEAFYSDTGKDLAQYAYEATQLRKDMLEMICTITNYDIVAMKDTITIDYVLSLIIDADALMRQAVDSVSNNGADGVSDSLTYNQQAYDKLVLGEQALGAIHTDVLSVDVQPLKDYLAAKKASAELAVASDQAFVDGDYDTYQLKTDEFSLKDEEAVALAALLPEDPNTWVYSAYDLATAELKTEYDELCAEAAENDAYLRDYLGVTIDDATTEEPVTDAQPPGEQPAAG